MIDKELLKKHLQDFLDKHTNESDRLTKDRLEREARVKYYQSFTKEKIIQMSREDMLEYISKLWAMLIWGNKAYYVDKIINDNGFDNFKKGISHLIWDSSPIEERWDKTQQTLKGMGPAMKSELLCHVHPNDFILWNRRAFVGLNYLGAKNLPRYDYQLNGGKYRELSNLGKEIVRQMVEFGFKEPTLLTLDYFIWDELQVVENLSTLHRKAKVEKPVEELSKEESKFIHNEVRDAIRDIGEWLGFNAETEKKVAEGSVVDTVWESKIGNMGRIMYVFEVQTKGSIDSLILNLLKAKNNPAVQGVVAVSDKDQLGRIQKHAADVPGLGNILKVWDYEEVLNVHDSLEFVNTSINKLNLVPEGF